MSINDNIRFLKLRGDRGLSAVRLEQHKTVSEYSSDYIMPPPVALERSASAQAPGENIVRDERSARSSDATFRGREQASRLPGAPRTATGSFSPPTAQVAVTPRTADGAMHRAPLEDLVPCTENYWNSRKKEIENTFQKSDGSNAAWLKYVSDYINMQVDVCDKCPNIAASVGVACPHFWYPELVEFLEWGWCITKCTLVSQFCLAGCGNNAGCVKGCEQTYRKCSSGCYGH